MVENKNKSKEQLLKELSALQSRIAELEEDEKKRHQMAAGRLEELLLESDECFRTAIERCNDGIFIVRNGKYFYANHKIAEMCGYANPDEIIGRQIGMLVHPDDREMAFTIYRRRLRGETVPILHAIRSLRKDGTFFHSEVAATKIMYRGEPTTMISVRDVTDRRRAEEEILGYKEHLEELVAERTARLTEANEQLKKEIFERTKVEKTLYESEERYRIIVEQTGQLVYDVDLLANRVTRSGAIRVITGYSPEEVQGGLSFWRERIHPDDREDAELLLNEARQQGTPYRLEYRFMRNDGTYVFIEDHGIFMLDDTNKPYRALGTMKDITSRKTAEDSLLESENKFRDLAEKTIVGIHLTQDGVFKYLNAANAEIHGYTVDEMLNTLGPKDFVLPEDWPKVERSMKRRLSGKAQSSRLETRIVTKKKEIKTVVSYGTRTIYQGKPAIIGTLLDITEQKRTMDELRKSKEDLENKSKTLEEVNVALKVLLRQREEDRKDLESRVASNVKQLILPYVQKMKKGQMDGIQQSCLSIIEANINEIVSPFLHTIGQLNFTPRESQVATLVKDGRTTKEIAALMGLECSAVDSYRNHIRDKLGLKNNRINLQSYLRSLR